jgi:hypothetical protein
VPLEPLHPDEPGLHRALRDALNQGLSSTDFFVWITVTPTGNRKEFENLGSLVTAVESWLAGLNPDEVDASELPEREFPDTAAEVRVRAIPKKPSARGQRAGEIVGNPEPILTGWVQ